MVTTKGGILLVPPLFFNFNKNFYMKAKTILLFMVLLISVAFSGCKSSRQVADTRGYKYGYGHEYGKKEFSRLSSRLKIDVSANDDIALFDELSDWLGVPYKYGGNTKKGVDCSGLVVRVFEKIYDKKLYRSSAMIMDKNCKSVSKKELRTGDLVFFATGGNRRKINHVGIYLKDGKFIHSSSSRGVIISDINESYYERTYVDSGRVI